MTNSRVFLPLLLLTLMACGGGSSSDDGDDDDDDETFTTDGVAPIRSGDLLAPSPGLDVPGPASALADTLLASTTFDGAYQVTLDILAEGGITTGFEADIMRAGKAPQSTTQVFPIFAVDLSLEAADRETMATYTLADFAAMMGDLGWPRVDGRTAQDTWVTFFADWYAAAEADVDAPDSFAILFIAAMNQRQTPPANIATGTEDPSLIRLSLLEAELLIGALDRVTTVPVALTAGLSTRPQKQTSQSPCSDYIKQAGVLGQAGQVVGSEVTGLVIGEALEAQYGAVNGGQMGIALSAAGIAAKVFKLIQQFRYGYIKLELTSPTPVKKPISTAANKTGDLRAVAGVDKQKYDDAVSIPGNQAAVDCMGSLGLPTKTDARDIANDAENWRVEWSIVTGGGSQVLWAPDTHWDITNGGFQKKVTRVDETTVETTVQFDILPQATKATVGKERRRKATFKVQLHRGSAPDLSSLWGAGKPGAAAANLNPIGAALGIADALTDITAKWALEGAAPAAYVSQELIEIEPTGLIGSLKWTIDGSAARYEVTDNGDIKTKETALIAQTGFIEIVSSEPSTGNTTAYGSETCRQTYGYGQTRLDVVEGSEIVGTRTDFDGQKYSDSWTSPQTSPRNEAALVADQTTPIEGLPPGVVIPGAGQVMIVLSPAVSCGPVESVVEFAIVDWDYDGTDGWVRTEESYDTDPVILLPSTLQESIIYIDRTPSQRTVTGERTYTETRQIHGLTVPVTQHLEWNLHWVE